ncbi:MAG: thiamine pyrophosphate-binding protein [Acetobacteraceae bacterium]|nr:thiamine pyrophosphate-binding protein [Acetobacteraceae bacterium]MSP30680.1 thiamine pyrophosphate-binding protein [Acetobacteraceae bacterium]
MKVYEAIAQSLIAEGVTDFFGLMGDGNMWLWGAICRDPKVRGFSARHESMSVSMADGYARTTGRVGVAMVTCGPGITQCGTSLIAAYRGKTPVVMIAGQIPAGSKNITQTMDQRRFVESCNTRFHTITSADNMAEEIAEAFYAARVHRCPVMLNLPMDLQEEDFDWEYVYRPSTSFLPKRMETPAPDILADVVEKLIAAERPVIVAGRGAIMAGAKDEIIKLAERTGALLATSLQGKGLFAGHEWNVGISGAFAAEPAERLLGEADFVLGVGAELGYYTTEGGLMFPSAEVARIDIRPMPDEIGVIPGLYVQADARKAVAALNAAMEARQVRKTGLRTAATKAVLNEAPAQFTTPTDGLDPRPLAWKLGAAVPKGALVTCGAGHFFSWVAMYMPLPEGSEIQFSYNFGAVGQGLGVMVGTAVGNPGRPHVAIEGDGSMMFNIQELETIIREKLNITLVVWNDGGYGAEVHKLTAKGFNEKLAQWESPDFVAVAKAFGGDGVKLSSVDEIGDAVATGLKKGGLYLIDARVSASTPTDPYAKVYHGIPSQAPLLRQPA